MNKSFKKHKKKNSSCRATYFSQNIQVRQTRNAGHCWRNKNELISNILLWTLTHRHTYAGWSTKTYIHQLHANTRCSLKDLPGGINDKDGWWERVRGLHTISIIWIWWLWWWLFIWGVDNFHHIFASFYIIFIYKHDYMHWYMIKGMKCEFVFFKSMNK